MTDAERREIDRMSSWQLARAAGRKRRFLLWPWYLVADALDEWGATLPRTSALLRAVAIVAALLYVATRACS